MNTKNSREKIQTREKFLQIENLQEEMRRGNVLYSMTAKYIQKRESANRQQR